MAQNNDKNDKSKKVVEVEQKPPKPPPTRLVFGKSNKEKKSVDDK